MLLAAVLAVDQFDVKRVAFLPHLFISVVSVQYFTAANLHEVIMLLIVIHVLILPHLHLRNRVSIVHELTMRTNGLFEL